MKGIEQQYSDVQKSNLDIKMDANEYSIIKTAHLPLTECDERGRSALRDRGELPSLTSQLFI